RRRTGRAAGGRVARTRHRFLRNRLDQKPPVELSAGAGVAAASMLGVAVGGALGGGVAIGGASDACRSPIRLRDVAAVTGSSSVWRSPAGRAISACWFSSSSFRYSVRNSL